MSRTPYQKVARVVKTRGLQGEVMAYTANGLPFCLYEGLNLWIVPPIEQSVRQTQVLSLSDINEESAFIFLEDISSIEEAEKIVGCYLLALYDDIEIEEQAFLNILNREVQDIRYGFLGTVNEYIETAANDVLVVQGPYGEVLIPCIDDVILSVPENEHEPIQTQIMKGLIKKGLSKNED